MELSTALRMLVAAPLSIIITIIIIIIIFALSLRSYSVLRIKGSE